MTPQDKLALGMALFLVFFVLAFLVVPPAVYQRYFADLRGRKKSRVIKALAAAVFLLALPYFYDQLVGLDSKALSNFLALAMSACAYLVLIDIVWFVYKNYGPPSQRAKRIRN